MEKLKNEDDLLYLTRTLNKLIRNDFDERLAKFGLTGIQGRALFFINKMVTFEHKEIHQNDLEREFKLTKSTVSGLVKRMEKNGLIKLDKTNRYTIITPTEKGSSVVDTIFKQRNETINKLFKGFTTDEQKKMIEYTNRIIKNLEGGKDNVEKD